MVICVHWVTKISKTIWYQIICCKSNWRYDTISSTLENILVIDNNSTCEQYYWVWTMCIMRVQNNTFCPYQNIDGLVFR